MKVSRKVNVATLGVLSESSSAGRAPRLGRGGRGIEAHFSDLEARMGNLTPEELLMLAFLAGITIGTPAAVIIKLRENIRKRTALKREQRGRPKRR